MSASTSTRPSLKPSRNGKRDITKTVSATKNLRAISLSLVQKLRCAPQGIPSTDIANQLAKEAVKQVAGMNTHIAQSDLIAIEKNIRRRLYDSLKVLVSIGAIRRSFSDKMLHWQGIAHLLPPSPSSSSSQQHHNSTPFTHPSVSHHHPPSQSPQLRSLSLALHAIRKRLDQKAVILQQLLHHKLALESLCRRNCRNFHNVHPTSKIYMPFVLVRTPHKARISLQSTPDTHNMLFHFSTHFEIVNDAGILDRMFCVENPTVPKTPPSSHPKSNPSSSHHTQITPPLSLIPKPLHPSLQTTTLQHPPSSTSQPQLKPTHIQPHLQPRIKPKKEPQSQLQSRQAQHQQQHSQPQTPVIRCTSSSQLNSSSLSQQSHQNHSTPSQGATDQHLLDHPKSPKRVRLVTSSPFPKFADRHSLQPNLTPPSARKRRRRPPYNSYPSPSFSHHHHHSSVADLHNHQTPSPSIFRKNHLPLSTEPNPHPIFEFTRPLDTSDPAGALSLSASPQVPTGPLSGSCGSPGVSDRVLTLGTSPGWVSFSTPDAFKPSCRKSQLLQSHLDADIDITPRRKYPSSTLASYSPPFADITAKCLDPVSTGTGGITSPTTSPLMTPANWNSANRPTMSLDINPDNPARRLFM